MKGTNCSIVKVRIHFYSFSTCKNVLTQCFVFNCKVATFLLPHFDTDDCVECVGSQDSGQQTKTLWGIMAIYMQLQLFMWIPIILELQYNEKIMINWREEINLFPSQRSPNSCFFAKISTFLSFQHQGEGDGLCHYLLFLPATPGKSEATQL